MPLLSKSNSMGSLESLRHQDRVRARAEFRPFETVLPIGFSPQGVPHVQTQNIEPKEHEFMGSIFYTLYMVPAGAKQVTLGTSSLLAMSNNPIVGKIAGGLNAAVRPE